MNQQQALKLLGLAEGATAQDIEQALAAKQQDIAAKQAAAPTDALKAKFGKILEQLPEAADLLMANSGVSPVNSPSSASSSNTSSGTSSRSQLSQTKLADLPGMATSDSAQLELQPNTVLANRYTIKELIGQGGMGAVYRAHDKNRDEEIAIKVLLPSLTNNERALERFLNEARVSSRLSHPNIVNVYDIQNDGELYFLTMELLEGQGLENLVQTREQLNQTFSAKELVEIIEQLAPALDYAHQHTVHRDIKPENIWLDEDGQYKLMDFGIAHLQSTSQRTQTGAAMGTAYYMAPEQLKGSKNIDARADIYALGVLLYALATGDVPAGVIKPLSQKRDDISPAFSDAVMQCLDADAEGRPASAGKLLELLQQGLNDPTPSVKADKNPANNANPLEVKGPNWAVLFIVIIALVGGFGALAYTGVIDINNLLPMSKEEIAQKKAASGKLIGEIKNYQRRIEGGRRQLNSDIKEAERNKSKALKALQHWQTLSENYLFNGSQLTELEGDLSTGEILLRDNSFELAEQTLTKVRDGYKNLWQQFSAAEKLHTAEAETNRARNAWQKRKKNYGLTDPEDVANAEHSQQAAKASQQQGDFTETLSHWQQATQHWQGAYNAVNAQVASIDKDRKAAAAAKAARIAAEKERKRKAEAARIKKLTGKIVTIPAGSFQMGSNNGDNDEKPVHQVNVRSFKMMVYEVTWNQYQPCINAGACPNNNGDGGDNGWGKGNRPVIEVSYNDITQHYIPWLNRQTGKRFRLPSEAEWEYAARAGSTTKYSWGNSPGNNKANCDGCGSQWDNSKTAPVGSFSPNAFGLYDMHGNVWEWTQDCWNDSYRGAPSNGGAWQSGDCSGRVLRGGSWYHKPIYLRSAFRFRNTATSRINSYGFRLVQD